MFIYYLTRAGSSAVVIAKSDQAARMYLGKLARSHGAEDPLGWLLEDVTDITAIGVTGSTESDEGVILLHND